MNIDLCKIVELPKIHDPRGNLTFIEGNKGAVGDWKSNEKKGTE